MSQPVRKFTHMRMPDNDVHPVVAALFVIMREQRVSIEEMGRLSGWSWIGRWRQTRWSPTLRAVSDCLAALGYRLVVEKIPEKASRETEAA